MPENIVHPYAVKVFYSYTHADEKFRDSLETHLSILRRKGYIDEWHDRKIIAGSDWESEIDSQLSSSDIILLLVSPDFIASDYCYSVEMEQAMELHESKDSVVVPIVIRPTGITDEPFASIQMLPTDRKPITTWDNEDIAWLDVVDGLKKTIEDIQEKNQRPITTNNKLRGVRSLLSEEVERMDAAFESDQNEYSGIATGFEMLDSMLDGVQNSEFWVIAARPQMGKTDFVLNILSNIAIGRKIPVAFFSMQLPSNKVIRKLISSLGRVDSYHQLTGQLTDDDWPRLTSAVHMLSEMESNIFINDKPVVTMNELTDSIKDFQKQHGIGVLILDGLQNIILGESNENVEPNKVSKYIKKLARELNLPIISTVHLPRELEQRKDKRPVLSDLGDWDHLSSDADVVMFIYRDEVYFSDTPERGFSEILVAKNNSGHIGMVRLIYLQKYSSFSDFLPEMYIPDDEKN